MPRHAANFKDLTGLKFGLLTVVQFVGNAPISKRAVAAKWKCICVCGKEHMVLGRLLRAGRVKSCGCRRNLPHGRFLPDTDYVEGFESILALPRGGFHK